MDKILLEGGVHLKGTVEVCGAKNAALPILFSTILTDSPCVIRNVPELRDVTSTLQILTELGMRCERRIDGSISVEEDTPDPFTAPYETVRQMRASICTLAPLLARRKRAKVSMPGGCVFGVRPVDLHLKGLAALGADIRINHGYIEAEAAELRGTTIYLGGPFGSSVLGTANVMMAATLAKGTTVIEAAACEPEIADLARFLRSMGARIEGIGTPRLVIEGVRELGGADHTIIPDRIEAGTFLIAGAITRGDVVVKGACIEHLTAVTDILKQVGLRISAEGDVIRVRTNGAFHPVDVTTLPYPGFPTDLQAQMMALLSLADGISVITEKVYPDRFIHVAELARMGAKIRKEGPSAIISGVKKLSGAPVMASDLRASACLVIAGLVATGVTEVYRIYHLDRGYERLEHRLGGLGAKIRREAAEPIESMD
ncbi:MAG TPA: UDP-N-acetylglucosamine 1-carboxyvinyltransferase [Planctomycetota bacterium]|nr:UDP-N-acetylglucosamine 1-carboxyvinyltransferase [Planctomycetota bacterium]